MATTFLGQENGVASTLDGAILAGDGTLDVQAGDAANFGAVNYHIVVGDTVQGFEIMTVTNVAGDTMTIARAAESFDGAAVALPFDDGTDVRLNITKEYATEMTDAINNIEDGTTVLTTVSTTGFIIAGGTALKYGSDDAEVQGANGYLGLVRDTAGDNGPALVGLKSDAGGAVTDDALLLSVFGLGHDGGDYNTVGAKIIMQVDGAPAANKIPCGIEFHTALGAVADDVALAMTIDKNKNVTIVGDLTVTGNNINDAGAGAITFDGAGNTSIDGTLTSVGVLTAKADNVFGTDWSLDNASYDPEYHTESVRLGAAQEPVLKIDATGAAAALDAALATGSIKIVGWAAVGGVIDFWISVDQNNGVTWGYSRRGADVGATDTLLELREYAADEYELQLVCSVPNRALATLEGRWLIEPTHTATIDWSVFGGVAQVGGPGLVTPAWDGSTIHFDGNGDATLDGNLTLGTAAANDGRLSFGNDADAYIHNETADTEIDIVATTTRLSGDLTVTGNAIKDAGGLAAISFDGATNTTAEGTLEVVSTFYCDADIELDNTGTFLRGVSIIEHAITWNGGAIQACATVADGYVVTDVYIEITTTFDGDAVVTVGDGATVDGFLTDADINQGALAYYGYDISARGAYLLNGDKKIYTGADTVDAFVTETTATQGAATVYVVIQRLK